MESDRNHFIKHPSVKCDGRVFAKEVLLPVTGLLGITFGLVLLFSLTVLQGKSLPPVIPPHMDDGEMVDPNPLRLAFMCVGLVVSLILAEVSIRKGEQGATYPAFWIGYAGGTLLWQSMGECAWHFSVSGEDFLMCFPHLEGASAVFLVLLVSLLLLYAFRHGSFGWGLWTFLLAFMCNWIGHFIMIGTYPFVGGLMDEHLWYLISGLVFGLGICILALILGRRHALDTRARLCCSMLLYMGIGIIVTGAGGI